VTSFRSRPGVWRSRASLASLGVHSVMNITQTKVRVFNVGTRAT
jgi:hypothetical protein